MVETLTLLLDLCAGKSCSTASTPPSPPTFQSFQKLPDKTNKCNCFLLGNTACSKSIFIKPARGEGKKGLEKGLCERHREAAGGRQGSAVPLPCPGSTARALPAFTPLPQQRFSTRTFLSEAAVPHHAAVVTKRRRYYGKAFSASYSRVCDSAAGRSRLLAGELAGNQSLPQHPTWPEPGVWQLPAVHSPRAPRVPLPAGLTAGIWGKRCEIHAANPGYS